MKIKSQRGTILIMDLDPTPSHQRRRPVVEGTDFGSTLERHKRGYNPEFFMQMNFEDISDDSDNELDDGLSFLRSDQTRNP